MSDLTEAVLETLIEKAARMIALHEYTVEIQAWIQACTCGWKADREYDTHAYDRHVARAVLEAVADDIRAQALREAADAWQQGGWGDAIPGPKINDRVPLILGMAQRAAEWLRSRADRLAGGESGPDLDGTSPWTTSQPKRRRNDDPR